MRRQTASISVRERPSVFTPLCAQVFRMIKYLCRTTRVDYEICCQLDFNRLNRFLVAALKIYDVK